MPWYRRESDELSRMAAVYARRGRVAQAENAYKLVIHMLETQGEHGSIELALAYFNLAELLCDDSRYGEAVSLYRKAVNIYQKSDPESGESALWYSAMLSKLQRIAEERALHDARARRKRHWRAG